MKSNIDWKKLVLIKSVYSNNVQRSMKQLFVIDYVIRRKGKNRIVKLIEKLIKYNLYFKNRIL